MISPIAQSLNSAYGVKELQAQIKQTAAGAPGSLPRVSDVEKPGGLGPVGPTAPVRGPSSSSFSDMLGDLVQAVDGKSKVSEAEAQKLMLGESNNIHQSMIAMQESGVAFSLLVEVRNKLVESYQELMRMPV
jgi:flagellar hook-basal body complex protein FliE